MKNAIILLLLLHVSLFSKQLKNIHFLISEAKGSSWDVSVRDLGSVLLKAKLVSQITYENIAGDSGNKAVQYLIKNAKSSKNTVLATSMPILVKHVRGIYAESYDELTPIASLAKDYHVLAVRPYSKYKNQKSIAKAYKQNPKRLKIAGANQKGNIDHIVASAIIKKAGLDNKKMVYVPKNSTKEALNALLSAEVNVLSTTLSEAIEYHKKGDIKIIGISSKNKIENIPTFKSVGTDVVFSSWRGFFGVPSLNQARVKNLNKTLKEATTAKEWKELQKRKNFLGFYKPANEFSKFLNDQERELSSKMRELGFK